MRPPPQPQRRSVRLQGYDYAAAGAYYVTICTAERQPVFGEVIAHRMRLSDAGLIAQDEWLHTASVRLNIELDAFVVMPDHIHAIVVIIDAPRDASGPGEFRSPSQTVGAIVRGYKGAVSRRLGAPVWQRSFYEHIVRDAADLERIRRYIHHNPARWGQRARTR